MRQNTENIIALTVRHLEQGHVILYPTDTVWGLGCDAFNERAVGSVFRIKQRPREKNAIILVSSVNMLKRYVTRIPGAVSSVLDEPQSPTTVIYPETRGIPGHLIAGDGSCAIRIVQHDFIRAVIERFGRPIISTSANFSGQPAARELRAVHPEIAKAVHFCVPSEFDTSTQKIPSRIIKVEADGAIKHIR